MGIEAITSPVYRVTCDACGRSETSETSNVPNWTVFNVQPQQFVLCDECKEDLGTLGDAERQCLER